MARPYRSGQAAVFLFLVVYAWVGIHRERRKNGHMKDEYDFSKSERGWFYRKDAVPVPPVHLAPEILAFLTARAEARGIPLRDLVNELLKKDIELIEAAQ